MCSDNEAPPSYPVGLQHSQFRITDQVGTACQTGTPPLSDLIHSDLQQVVDRAEYHLKGSTPPAPLVSVSDE
jgi:hypothetical protein